MSSSIQLLDLPADRLDGQVSVAFYFEDERPLHGPVALLDWRLNGVLTKKLLSGELSGKSNEQLMVVSNGKVDSDWILFQGGGRRKGLAPETYISLVRNLFMKCEKMGTSRLALSLSPIDGLGYNELERAVRDELSRIGTFDCLLSIERRLEASR